MTVIAFSSLDVTARKKKYSSAPGGDALGDDKQEGYNAGQQLAPRISIE